MSVEYFRVVRRQMLQIFTPNSQLRPFITGTLILLVLSPHIIHADILQEFFNPRTCLEIVLAATEIIMDDGFDVSQG